MLMKSVMDNLAHPRIENEKKGSSLYDLNENQIKKTGKCLGVEGKMQEMDTVYHYDGMNRMIEKRRYSDLAESQGMTQSQFNEFMNNPKFCQTYNRLGKNACTSHKIEARIYIIL